MVEDTNLIELDKIKKKNNICDLLGNYEIKHCLRSNKHILSDRYHGTKKSLS